MTATTVERLYDGSAALTPAHGTFGVAADQQMLKGTIVVLDSNGFADTPAAGQNAAGIAEHSILGGSSDGDEEVEVSYGVHGVLFDGTAPKPGEVVYVLDNQTVTLVVGTNGIAGICSETKNGKCYVWFGPHVATLASGV